MCLQRLSFPSIARKGTHVAVSDALPQLGPLHGRLLLVIGLSVGLAALRGEARDTFGFQQLCEYAKALSTRPADDGNEPSLPPPLKDLNYDTYRMICYCHEKGTWVDQGLPFQLQYAHRGYLFGRRVDIRLIEADKVVDVPFSPHLFRYYGPLESVALPDDLGFAGFRVLYPLNSPDRYDEVISFLGATYFRAVGQGAVYGSSARGLAVNAGLPIDEEFPVFTSFWIERPAKDSTSITIYALMQGNKLGGAYRFVVAPGQNTTVDITARLFIGVRIQQLGIAPLTSMFWYGEGEPQRDNSGRPEVHDADGLLMVNGNSECLWRPLGNPDRQRVNHYQLVSPKGFGLLQRDRVFKHYLDREAKSDLRPSLWVEPLEDWSQGRVVLLEWPAEHEGEDNILAFWTTGQPVAEGELGLRYRMHFCSQPPATCGGKAIATMIRQLNDRRAEFQVDFQGERLASLAGDQPPEAVVTAPQATIADTRLSKLAQKGEWRLTFQVALGGRKCTDLRAFLRHRQDALTETWSYPWCPLN